MSPAHLSGHALAVEELRELPGTVRANVPAAGGAGVPTHGDAVVVQDAPEAVAGELRAELV
jgi:hypothetical protein